MNLGIRNLSYLHQIDPFIYELLSTHIYGNFFMESYSIKLWNGEASIGIINTVFLSHNSFFFPTLIMAKSFQWQNEKNSMVLQLTIFDACLAFGILALACELSQRIENTFIEIDAIIGRCDWYLYPIEIQRILPMIISMTQQPVTIECFGSASCNRDQFKKVNSANHLVFSNCTELSTYSFFRLLKAHSRTS